MVGFFVLFCFIFQAFSAASSCRGGARALHKHLKMIFKVLTSSLRFSSTTEYVFLSHGTNYFYGICPLRKHRMFTRLFKEFQKLRVRPQIADFTD